MRRTLYVWFCFLLVVFLASTKAQTLGDANDLPFTLQLVEVTKPAIPGVHSFALGKVDDYWVVIGGRINGLHGFFMATAFPEDKANSKVLLIQPEAGTLVSYEVADLNLPFGDALLATNPQYTQYGDWLYIVGGYGKEDASEQFKTFPILTAVDLPLLKTKMLNGENPAVAFRQVEVQKLQVCGGEMEKMGEWFYLVGGHNFSGLYNQTGPPTFVQEYTNEIKRFKIVNTPDSLGIAEYTVFHSEEMLHRRDFTLAPLLLPDSSEALCLYGGVFRPNEDLPFYHPVYISEDFSVTMDISYEQLFSQYTCPAVPIFDSLDGSMNTLLFAGLSVHYWDNGLLYDENVPFIKDITTFRRSADGTTQEYLMPQRFDELLGTNMVFVLNDDAPHYRNEVLNLRAMNGTTFVGYLFGGIKAEFPNITPSSASQRMFKVYITPKMVVNSTTEPEKLSLAVHPNPFSGSDFLQFENNFSLHHLTLALADGRVLAKYKQPQANGFDELRDMLQELPAGIYFLHYDGVNASGVLKLVKQ